MKAVKLVSLLYHKHFQMKAIYFQINNTTGLSYLVKMGEPQYPLHHGITITTACLPSSVKVEADWQLRNSKDQSKWKLLPQVFQSIFQRKSRDGSFCFSTVSTTSMVHCMETRSIQSGNGCCARNLVQSVPL